MRITHGTNLVAPPLKAEKLVKGRQNSFTVDQHKSASDMARLIATSIYDIGGYLQLTSLVRLHRTP